MIGVRRRRRQRSSSVTDWLDLLTTEGPFLAGPVAKEVWPNGLPALEHEAVQRLREASARLEASPGTRDSFVREVLGEFLGWGDRLLTATELPPGLVTPVPEHATEVRPDFALAGREGITPALLGLVTPPGTRAGARVVARGASTWTASPSDRLAHALRVQGVPLGLVTDGGEWTLVCLTRGAVSSATWTRHIWLDDVETLKTFHALLCRQRFFGVEDERTLPALLDQSIDRQEEITQRLKEQAQAVVDMLVATVGRLDAEANLRRGVSILGDDVEPSDVYAACVTVLMRTLFLLYAEELSLLPIDDPEYSGAYAASTLASELRERANERGEDALERSSVAWQRLLATSRALHRGARHPDLLLPAYGGGLFDPDRFPWLEGRSARDPLGSSQPLAIDDRTMLHSLEALQTLQFGRERRRISFRQLDVEQIGYVYEGLIGQDATRSDEWVLGVAGDSAGERDGPELALSTLELKLEDGPDAFAAWLAPLTKTSAGGRSERAILKDLRAETDDRRWRAVLEACGGDEPAARSILPFGGLLRRDPRDLPVVYPPRSLYLTDSSLKAHTGAVYTPRTLAEQVVEGALAPLVYAPGPLDTEDRLAWRLVSPASILALRVVDIAAGSGAFLVGATRYLAARLVEARELHDGAVARNEKQAVEIALEARRRVVDHCIYGVDVNPMAVEMCKLSLWLVTLDPTRPFTFLDDRIACGDSLLGITSVDQLVTVHMDPERGRATSRLPTFDADVRAVLEEAAELRRRIADIPLIDSHSADDKARLLNRTVEATSRLRRVADALSAASLLGGQDYGIAGELAAALVGPSEADPGQIEERVRFALTDRAGHVRVPAHFPLLFPEVFSGDNPGFDAVIGNPPYLGGQKISGVHGIDYRDHLVRQRGRGTRGSADLVAYMLLTAAAIARDDRGTLGLITTNTIAQGETREVGLEQLIREDWDIPAAIKSAKWPTRAVNLEYSVVWTTRRHRSNDVRAVADGVPTARITSSLDPAGRASGQVHRLAANAGIAFQGNIVLGMGFTMSKDQARALIDADSRNAEVLFPYLNGEDLNSRPDCSASRWVVQFDERSEAAARAFAAVWTYLEDNAKPERMTKDAVRYPRMVNEWWKHWNNRRELAAGIASLGRVLAITLVSKVVLPVFVPTGQVYSHAVGVFACDDPAFLALLSSAPHYWWAISRASTMRTDLRYTPSDVFETFPLPPLTGAMRTTGDRLDRERRDIMLSRQLGLTKTYNLVHDPVVRDADIRNLRGIHVAIDEAVCAAYEWADLVLAHGHYETRQGMRWTVAPAVQQEILDRLLELNHQRHAEEQAAGNGQVRRRGRRGKQARDPMSESLFTEDAV